MVNNQLEKEVTLFCRYLINETPTNFVIELYSRTVLNDPVTLSSSDKKILQFAINQPWSIRILDAGTALIKPGSELRKRLYIMFAILESTTEYAHHFLTKDRSVFYLFTIFFAGIRSVISVCMGIILLKIIS